MSTTDRSRGTRPRRAGKDRGRQCDKLPPAGRRQWYASALQHIGRVRTHDLKVTIREGQGQ